MTNPSYGMSYSIIRNMDADIERTVKDKQMMEI